MTVALVTLQFGDKAYFELSRWLLTDYAKRHGYELHVGDGAVPDDRAKHWGKLTAIKNALETADLVLYLDADCVIVDPTREVVSLVPLMLECDLLLSRDSPWNVNTGVMLATRHAFDLFEAWEALPLEFPELAHKWPLDELAFNEWLLPRYPSRIAVPPLQRGTVGDFHTGSFVHHFPNGDAATKLERMSRASRVVP